jgi:sensor domain CHASE-containing protein
MFVLLLTKIKICAYNLYKLMRKEKEKMDIATLLGSYAFPVVACIVMAIYVKEITQNNREDTKALNEQHTKEMNAFKDEIKEALNNNTIALTKLCERLEREEGKQ